MVAFDELTTVAFASWDDYWAVRHDQEFWEPWFRWALDLTGVESADVSILQPSQYPTARCGDVVVTIYPDARFVFELEREAHALLAESDLPVPKVIDAGSFPTRGEPVWQWLIESAATGVPWNQTRATLTPDRAREAAAATGTALQRFHQTAHASGRLLDLDWTRFDQLIRDEVDHLGHNDGRLQNFPERFLPGLHDLARSTYAAVDTEVGPRLVHGDVHGDNVFVDPTSGALTGIIDLNEMYVGDPWYDLADACFRLLRGQPGLTAELLRGYGADQSAEVRAERLLGWGLLHDFDGLTVTIAERGIGAEIETVGQLAGHLTGLVPMGRVKDRPIRARGETGS